MKVCFIKERELFPSLECVITNCNNKPQCRGFCRKHLDEEVKKNRIRIRNYNSIRGCKVVGCY